LSRTSPPRIHPLSLHDALPIYACNKARAITQRGLLHRIIGQAHASTVTGAISTSSRLTPSPSRSTTRKSAVRSKGVRTPCQTPRSEEHTSELQSRENLVCRLLL